jgi:hypothetical protein
MRWTPGGSSDDVEDRRDSSGGGFRGIHLGIGGFILVAVLSLIFHRNFFTLLDSGSSAGGGTSISQPDPTRDAAEKPLVDFVTFVLNDTQQTWSTISLAQGVPYRHAKLVLYRDSLDSACGMAQSATGPFYCPEDEKVYIDLGFYDELKQRFGAPVVVVDFGTAVTFDVVNARGDYVGGIIAPGLAAMTDYLHEKTALLPRIKIREVSQVVGKNTEQAMLIGAVHGYRGLVSELIAELRRELNTRRLPVVATGGYAKLIASKLPGITAVEPLLTLEGLRLVWQVRR